ncbi:MAG: DNA/RNA non-specific endonuclease [Lachnospiraceae bacterium]|nr:DNA/RNA non-specific endonuclease [Lachnospiraceae bacterium]
MFKLRKPSWPAVPAVPAVTAVAAAALLALFGCGAVTGTIATTGTTRGTPVEAPLEAVGALTETSFTADDIPAYTGEPYAVINNNIPYFADFELTTESFECYSDLDSLGRCGTAYANISQDSMPTGGRELIGQIRPSGWHTVKYDNVDGRYLYNRCHLIGYQLSGENANERNLITGTRYLNTIGMLPFENLVGNYVRNTNHHVLQRVTPVFDGDHLVASGVLMEAKSVEDNGAGVLYNIFVYNVQPGITIDYATGDSSENEDAPVLTKSVTGTYILNIRSGKFHRPTCQSVKDMKEYNKRGCDASREDLVAQGYLPCKSCNP